MEFSSFADLQRHLQALYHKNQFSLALELATRLFDRFPEDRALLYYWRIILAAQTDDESESLRLLKEALTSGIWYGEALLRKNPSLKSLQGLPEFEKLVRRNQKLAQEDRKVSFPMLTLRPEGCCQPGDAACPLLIALHANGNNAQGSMGFWKPAAAAGWLVATPQSTQAVWKGAFVWDDREIAEREVMKHYSLLRSGYSIDPHRTVLAGHSSGGETAMWLALKGVFEIAGFIAIDPGGAFMDDLKVWEPLIHENLNGSLRGYVIIGEADPEILQKNIRKLVERFVEEGISCELEVIPGAGNHQIPGYEPAFLRALDFLAR